MADKQGIKIVNENGDLLNVHVAIFCIAIGG